MLRQVFVLCFFGAIGIFGAKFRKLQKLSLRKNEITILSPTAASQQKCKAGDSSCIVKVANEIMTRGKQGYREIGLPVFDPLRIEKLNIEHGGSGPVNLKINLKNFQLGGLSETKFNKIDGFGSDYDKVKMELSFKYPLLTIDGPYKLDGKVLVLPVQGEGIAHLKFRMFHKILIKISSSKF